VLAEGFDDDGEEGSGEKLLGVLQKMDIGNILVIICVWNSGV
jgi:putative IMPACT (imprinted ancient) family translation regulator